jgi:hypothetical protein
MSRQVPRMPTPHISQPVKVTPFAVGASVLLAACPFGQPGTVLGARRNMIRVRWEDGFVGHHKIAALVGVDHQEHPADGPKATLGESAGTR